MTRCLHRCSTHSLTHRVVIRNWWKMRKIPMSKSIVKFHPANIYSARICHWLCTFSYAHAVEHVLSTISIRSFFVQINHRDIHWNDWTLLGIKYKMLAIIDAHRHIHNNQWRMATWKLSLLHTQKSKLHAHSSTRRRRRHNSRPWMIREHRTR